MPNYNVSNVPTLAGASFSGASSNSDLNERELLYKVLYDMKKDLNDLKKVVRDIIQSGSVNLSDLPNEHIPTTDSIQPLGANYSEVTGVNDIKIHNPIIVKEGAGYTKPIEVEESLSLQDKEIDMIKKALKKHKGKRKYAAQELGISERTLYRKINEHKIEE